MIIGLDPLDQRGNDDDVIEDRWITTGSMIAFNAYITQCKKIMNTKRQQSQCRILVLVVCQAAVSSN